MSRIPKVLGLLFLLASPAAASDGVDFEFGDSCMKLSELNYDVLEDLTMAAEEEEEGAEFCRVAPPDDCVGMSFFVSDFGELTPAARRGMCAFKPWDSRW